MPMSRGLRATESAILFTFKIVFVALFFSSLVSVAAAQFQSAMFWKNRSWSLKFITSSQSLAAGLCSGVTTLGIYNAKGVLSNATSNLTISLTGSGTTTFYSDSACTVSISQVNIALGTSSASYYFVDSVAETLSLTIATPGFQPSSQPETISVNSFVWTGSGANANWTTGANWSGGVAPNSSQIALFNSSCTANCSPTINSSINIGGLRVATGFAGTITQNSASAITVGGYGWVQKAGTFVGSSSSDAIVTNGDFNLYAGIFTATNGVWQHRDFFTISSTATFNSNSGQIFFYHGCVATPAPVISLGSSTLNSVKFGGSCNATFTITNPSTISVLGNLDFQEAGQSHFNSNAVIQVTGNINMIDWGGWVTGGTIKTVGVNQTITGASAGEFPNLEIASSGTVTISGTINIGGGLTYTSGTISPVGSTLYFDLPCAPGVNTATISPGNQSYGNVGFTGSCNANWTITSPLKVQDLSLSELGQSHFNSSAVVEVSGNINLIAWGGWNTGGKIKTVGVNQTVTSAGAGFLPNFEIASTGTVTLSGTIQLYGSLTYTSGTVSAAGSTLLFYVGCTTGVSTAAITPGSETYGNVIFSGSCNPTYTLSGIFKVGGNASFVVGGASLNGGSLSIAGNLSASAWGGGNTALIITGAASTVTQTGGTFPAGTLTYNNGAGTLKLVSPVSFNSTGQTVNLSAGTIDMNGFALTTKGLTLNSNTITKNAGVLNVNGTTVSTGALYGGTVNP